MALALLNALPYDVVAKVNEYTIELSVTQRLNTKVDETTWRDIHRELAWRVGGALHPMVPMRWPGYLILKRTPIVPPYYLPLYNRLEPAMCKHIPEEIEYSFATRSSTPRGVEIRQINTVIKAAGLLLGVNKIPIKYCLGEWIEIERAIAVANDTAFNQLPDFPDSDEDDESYWETDGEDWQGADWEPHEEEDWDF